METTVTEISPSQLLLDPNNYRFLDIAGYRKVAKRERYGEDGVHGAMQSSALLTSAMRPLSAKD